MYQGSNAYKFKDLEEVEELHGNSGLNGNRSIGMGRTWEKFSSLPAKKPQKFETATGKENF